MHYLYILYSRVHDLFYIGHTQNPHRRFHEHNNSDLYSFTAKYRPWDMAVLFECGPDKSVATALEKHIKQQKSKEYIRKIIIEKSVVSFPILKAITLSEVEV